MPLTRACNAGLVLCTVCRKRRCRTTPGAKAMCSRCKRYRDMTQPLPRGNVGDRSVAPPERIAELIALADGTKPLFSGHRDRDTFRRLAVEVHRSHA